MGVITLYNVCQILMDLGLTSYSDCIDTFSSQYSFNVAQDAKTSLEKREAQSASMKYLELEENFKKLAMELGLPLGFISGEQPTKILHRPVTYDKHTDLTKRNSKDQLYQTGASPGGLANMDVEWAKAMGLPLGFVGAGQVGKRADNTGKVTTGNDTHPKHGNSRSIIGELVDLIMEKLNLKKAENLRRKRAYLRPFYRYNQ